jgi:hypothetical protein
MPRYYFDIHEGRQNHTDELGEELADRHAAWTEATRYAGEALKDVDGKLKPGEVWQLDVRDEFANLIYVLQVRAFGPA